MQELMLGECQTVPTFFSAADSCIHLDVLSGNNIADTLGEKNFVFF